MFRFIGHLLARAWRTADFWRIPMVDGVRIGSPLAAGTMFLFLVFLGVGMALLMLGFDLDQVDLWLEAQGGWLDALGTLMLKGLCLFILLMCVLIGAGVLLAAVFDRESPERPGVFGALMMSLGALVVGWFAWNGLFI
jgi:hypothetical protein